MVYYRKFRPQKFADILGQEHIVQTLTNALSSGDFSHGYLFAGPRGTGKTTLARVMAKALNCTGRSLAKDSFEPCNKCSSCKEITLGRSLDLIEIDAASNRGIDEIRDLREKIRFAPTKSKYKIYIIDEVHMLTKEAFNALLKTLEEPPKHAIFMMATTEPQKILPTILSRVQRFDFRRAELEELKKLLKKIAQAEAIKIDDEAIGLLAQLSTGSYRDALSLFGQISSVRKTIASNITLEQIQQILGLAQDKSVFDFAEALAMGNRKLAFELISKLNLQGIDFENFTVKLIETLRKIALWELGEDQLFDLTHEYQDKVKKMAEIFEINLLMKMIEKFALALPQIKSASIPQLPLEMIVFEFTKSCHSEQSNVTLSEAKSLSRMRDVTETSSEILPPPRRGQNDKNKSTKNLNQDLWTEIIKGAKAHNHSLAALLKDAVLAETCDNTITLAFKFKFHADIISGKRNTQAIEGIILKNTGTAYKLNCIVNPELVVKKPTDSEDELLSGAKEVFEVEE
ncbi:MAG: polymerase III gamma/tau subunit protein [Berkelbacteria bacterium GW2011_GWA1_36_9]|uniref:DNA polymerase III subunit gamma/tau n=1 Tax=Berkelbacteria bacterium GW2011_GWA1_36_9 TaxID=1618331 RepID=A0A0G0I202_9BACT|nr:MAG: polymerase III gamma/tau subunit protein [Berkelbacteria bacterium GW2011_GWA1_36_9]